MKKTFQLFILLIPFFTLSQNREIAPGIYKTFEEFKNNRPSVEFFGRVKSQDLKYGYLGSRKVFTEYLLKIPKEKSKEIGDVFGFCDGKDFYIATYPHHIYDYAFTPVEFISKDIVYFESLDNGYLKYILRMDTGEIRYLTNYRIKKILKSKPVLLKEFKNQSNKSDHIKDYLIKFYTT